MSEGVTGSGEPATVPGHDASWVLETDGWSAPCDAGSTLPRDSGEPGEGSESARRRRPLHRDRQPKTKSTTLFAELAGGTLVPAPLAVPDDLTQEDGAGRSADGVSERPRHRQAGRSRRPVQPVATPIPGDAGPGSQIRGRPLPPDFQRRLTWAHEYSSEVLSRIEDAAYLGNHRELDRLVRTYRRSPQAKLLAAYKTQKQRRGDTLDTDRVLEVSHAINVDDPWIEPSMFFTYKDGKHGIEMPAIAYGDVEHAT